MINKTFCTLLTINKVGIDGIDFIIEEYSELVIGKFEDLLWISILVVDDIHVFTKI